MRFIPAYAGNSIGGFWGPEPSTVHPRLRGELECSRGSTRSFRRFIPAYAGNSSVILPMVLINPVLPRLRGELMPIKQPAVWSDGSSPLTRGTLQEYIEHIPSQRFIPAYAGNSIPSYSLLIVMTVHPRLRGELA